MHMKKAMITTENWQEEFDAKFSDKDIGYATDFGDYQSFEYSGVYDDVIDFITTLLAAKDREIEEAIAEESERMVVEVIKVIVSEYKSATNSYKIAKMNVEKGKKWAEADCISENSKQVVLSRLEPKISNLLSSLDTLLTDKE